MSEPFDGPEIKPAIEEGKFCRFIYVIIVSRGDKRTKNVRKWQGGDGVSRVPGEKKKQINESRQLRFVSLPERCISHYLGCGCGKNESLLGLPRKKVQGMVSKGNP